MEDYQNPQQKGKKCVIDMEPCREDSDCDKCIIAGRPCVKLGQVFSKIVLFYEISYYRSTKVHMLQFSV